MLVKRLSPPCWRRVTLRGQSALAGESGRTELRARSANRAQSTSWFDGCENKKPRFNCQLVQLRVQGRFTRPKLSSELRGEKWRWSIHGEQSVSRRGGAGKEWKAAHEGSPDLRCSVSTQRSTLTSIVSVHDNCFPYKSRHKA